MITLEANYSKKIGLPGFSSHQFSITLKTEITDVALVQQESARLYSLLQSGVDTSLRQIGFLPAQAGSNGNNGQSNGQSQAPRLNGHPTSHTDLWSCSPNQKRLILDIVEENRLDKETIERLAQDRFSKGVRQLNKLEASGLIDELLARHGKPARRTPVATGGGRR